MIEQTRKQINRLFEEVARMSEVEMTPAEYYREFLNRVLAALAAPAGAVWGRTPQGNLQLQYQVNMQQVGVNRNETSRQSHDELLRQTVQNGKPVHLAPHSSAGPGDGMTAAPGNPTDYLILLVPILVEKQVAGLVEVWQMADRHPSAIPGFLTFMSHMAELAARYTRHMTMSQLTKQQQLWGQLEVFARQVHGSLKPMEVAYQVANEGRRLIDCDRVSVAIRLGKKVRVEAVSGADIVERRSNLVQLMRKLFDAVLNWGEKLVYSGVKDDSLPPDVLSALDAYLAESNSKLLAITPLRDEREKDGPNPPRSVLMMECFEPAVSPEQLTARLEVVGRHSAPALYNAIEHHRIPFRFIWSPIAKVQEGLGGKARAIGASIAAGVVLAFLAFYFVPYQLKMDSTGELLPEVRAWVFSPAEGRIERFQVAPNDKVPEDYILAYMHDFDLENKLTELNAQIEGSLRTEQTFEGEMSRGGVAPSDKMHLAEQLAQARSQRIQKEKTKELLVKKYQAQDQGGLFKLVAPKFPPTREFSADRNWTVLNRDFRENLGGKNVKPSDQLLRLGFVEGFWEVQLKIPQKHIGQVLRGFERENTDELDVDLLVKSAPTRVFKGKLARDRVGGEAVPNMTDQQENEPVVLCSVRITGDDIPKDDQISRELLVTGTEVHAKVLCGKHKLGYSLFYGVWEFVYEKIFNFF
jgi:hypothetical protein